MNALADMHVHSTFSDGRDRIEDNIAECESLGLVALGCVDHVRADTDWVRKSSSSAPARRQCASRPFISAPSVPGSSAR